MPTPHIIVVMDGGLIQEIISPIPLDYTVLDYDIEGADPEDLAPIPQTKEDVEMAYCRESSAGVDPGRVKVLLDAIEASNH